MNIQYVFKELFNRVGVLKAAFLLGAASCASAAEQPNILFIMADDHAANAISAYESRLSEVFSTPNIDRLADEGVRLDNAMCTNALCAPSRASILTGQYSHENGVYTLYEALNPDSDNVAKRLQEAGYRTAIIGKWHLYSEPTGFDFYQVLKSQGSYTDPGFRETGLDEGQPDFRKRKQHEIKGYTTDIVTDLAIDWLDQRDKTKPFFLMVCHKAPHGPFKYADRHEHALDGVEIPEPASLWEDQSHRSAGSRGLGLFIEKFVERAEAPNYPTGQLDTTGMTPEEKRKAGYQKYLKDYLRTVMSVDDSVGRLTDYIDEHGLKDNTIIIYTSDQGMFLGEHNYIDKRWMFEEALQMPFIIRYPGGLEAGTINDDICLNIDFAPTFLDYAGAEVPVSMQGRSLRPVLEGNTPPDWRDGMYYRYWMQDARPAHFGIRTKDAKLIFYYGQALGLVPWGDKQNSGVGWEFYDLEKDPNELHNEYDNPAYADQIKRMKEELAALRERYGDTDSESPAMQKIIEANWN